MQKSETNQTVSAHRRVRTSTTLNRKYVSRPASTTQRVVVRKTQSGAVGNTGAHKMTQTVRARMQVRTQSAQPVARLTAQELKERAIRKALADANRIQSEENQPKMMNVINKSNQKQESTKKLNLKSTKTRFGLGRVVLAFGCAVVAVFAIVWLVNTAMPDLQQKVNATHTGIENPYPSYVPRGYSVTDATYEDGKVVLTFNDSDTESSFTLTEERSSWDSNALLSNYVKKEYGENHTVVREQGLTLYISNSDASWVNGGVVYKIKTNSGSLTKKQIRSIATSL